MYTLASHAYPKEQKAMKHVWLWAIKNNRLLHNHPFPLITVEDFRSGQLPLTLYFCMQLSSLETWFWNHRCWNKSPFFQALCLKVFQTKQCAPGKLCIYSIIENLAAIVQVLVKDAIQVHLHILHLPCRSCHIHTAFHAVLQNKYQAAQTEFLLVSQLFSSVLKDKRAVFWCFVNNNAHTKYLFSPTGIVPNAWLSWKNAYQMLLIFKFQKNRPVSEKATKLKGNKDLSEIYQNPCSGLAGFKKYSHKECDHPQPSYIMVTLIRTTTQYTFAEVWKKWEYNVF